MGSGKKDLPYIICGLAVFAAILLSWELAGRSGLVSPLALPWPSKVFVAAPQEITSPIFLSNWFRTLAVWLASLSCGLAVGLVLGFIAGADRGLALVLLPSLGYLRSIPPIAMFPVALIAIGPGVGVVATLGAALYVFPGTAEAARQAAERFSQLAAILGARKGQFPRVFVAPGAALQALASSRVAATYAFAVCVAGEMIIGGRAGVGAAILDLSERYRLEEAYAYVLCTGIVGLVIDSIFGRLSKMRILGSTANPRVYM